MLVAQTSLGLRISLVSRWQKCELQRLRQEQLFICPVCQGPVQLRLGPIRKWHFAHKKERACQVDIEPESADHIRGKVLLFQWLAAQGLRIYLEPYLKRLNQRPDLLVKHEEQFYAIEYQASSLSEEQLRKRTFGYLNAGITPIWILAGKRLKRQGRSTFSFSRFEWLTARNYQHSDSPFLTYFSPLDKAFVILSQLTPYSITKATGHLRVHSLPSLTFQQVLQGPAIPPQRSSTVNPSWLSIKKHWRYQHPRNHLRIPYSIKQMFLNQHISPNLYPPEAGWPTDFHYLIETPTYLWQSWILFEFLQHQPIGKPFHFRLLSNAFKPMLTNQQLKQRVFPQVNGHYSAALLAYLDWLIKIELLSHVDQQVYVKNKEITIPLTLPHALKKDEQLMSTWHAYN
ncbi:competence protein CoiA [Desertibacillus haloalkaliphilus]|uniref:competence protein CoiA n=1 Tax=Desertibacillus haloalkaliphilus TaxID=1328930 RepID=UPI001C25EB58|nr:competence protein CoiA family protein [Desertibacillus haloalkaliphilus]MBU8906912.1 hypothetical protein [Desertibacillus haloalkaliphilus]